MKFDTEVFISYAHLDNQGARQGHEWISDFHRALAIRVGQLLGKEPQIWRDPKLHGNDVFADTLIERLERVATLVSIVSPRYLKSEWTRRELEKFCQAAHQSGGLDIDNKARIFKVVKTPVARDLELPPLASLLGYEFFKIDPESGRPREFDDPDEKEYWIKIDDVAHDMCQLLEILESDRPPSAAGKKTVYLAETTLDMADEHAAIRRELLEHGYGVLPAQTLPLVESELVPFVRSEMARCNLSIHLVGKTYSLVPEGGMRSLLEVQDEVALERAEKGNFGRLVWIPPGLQIQDERQRKFIECLRLDPRIQHSTDLLETSLEDFKSTMHERLNQKPIETKSAARLKQMYLIFDRQDLETIGPWRDFLFEHFEVICSVFDGDEAEIRAYHEENLRLSDVVLIHYGAGSEIWLRRKLRELLKSSAYGRTEPFRAVGILVAPPCTPQKRVFKTHEAMIISQFDGFAAEPFAPFLNLAKAG
ncbi:MAG TPA: toll/interleukin-1 receptor domain-containing protein [Bryobacteraceae bacterium]